MSFTHFWRWGHIFTATPSSDSPDCRCKSLKTDMNLESVNTMTTLIAGGTHSWLPPASLSHSSLQDIMSAVSPNTDICTKDGESCSHLMFISLLSRQEVEELVCGVIRSETFQHAAFTLSSLQSALWWITVIYLFNQPNGVNSHWASC